MSIVIYAYDWAWKNHTRTWLHLMIFTEWNNLFQLSLLSYAENNMESHETYRFCIAHVDKVYYIKSNLRALTIPDYFLQSTQNYHCLHYIVPTSHSDSYIFSFFPSTIQAWNNKPILLVETNSLQYYTSILMFLYNVLWAGPRTIKSAMLPIQYFIQILCPNKTLGYIYVYINPCNDDDMIVLSNIPVV